MTANGPRIIREKKTIAAMMNIFCKAHHGTKGTLCSECQQLLEYAHARLDACSFGEEKPVCIECTIHCYKPDMRERIRAVMRYAGPRMLLRHPVLAICHLLDSRKR